VEITIYTNETEVVHRVPYTWTICTSCSGHGTDRGASVECDGGGFTATEWSEQDDDFKQDYLSGVYDRPCRPCSGLGRVQTPDLDALDPKVRAAYEQQLSDDCDFRALQAAERRMGA